jgi:hypothetical protein
VAGIITQVNGFILQGNVRVDDIEFHKISSGEFPITTSGYQFFGVIETNGFRSFEILEPEGSPGDQEIIFNADDFSFGIGVQGDCNEDGTVTSADVTCTILEIFNPPSKLSADCNGDGSVTSADVTCTILCIFGMCP